MLGLIGAKSEYRVHGASPDYDYENRGKAEQGELRPGSWGHVDFSCFSTDVTESRTL